MAKFNRMTKAELIRELEQLQYALESDVAAKQLAVVQKIEKALAEEHDLDAIYDAVGCELVRIFDAQTVMFYEADRVNNLMHFLWGIELGTKETPDPVPLNSLYQYFMNQKGTVLINEGFEEFASKFKDYRVPYGLAPKSLVSVPVIQQPDRDVIISLQDMEHEHAFSQQDVKLLETLAAAMRTALENARLFDETQQRNAELAIVNSVSEAITKNLDVQSVLNIVGDKVQEIFQAEMVAIGLINEEKGVTELPYSYALGEHFEESSFPLGEGLAGRMFRTREPLLLSKREELIALGTLETEADRKTEQEIESWLGVPIIIGDKLIGGVSVQSYKKHAFDDRDLRLLSTLAANMGAVIENARLFNDTNQRAAELAVINTIQSALVAELDIQGIYDLVGDKIQEIFQAQAVIIGSFDHEKGTQRANYFLEKGERQYPPEVQISGLMKHLIETGETLVFNERAREETEKHGAVTLGEEPQTAIFVPLKVGSKVTGAISLQDVEREHAYQESDVRLLETLAGSMSVALENARLFEETQARNAELAIINSVQDALSAELDIQGIYDVVGDKVQEIFDAQTVMLIEVDEEKDLSSIHYLVERGKRYFPEPSPLTGLNKLMLEKGETYVLQENTVETLSKVGVSILSDPSLSVVFVPLRSGPKIFGFISIQNVDTENAYSSDEIRLLETLAGSMSVALENARLFEETQARNAELAIINTVQEGLAAELDMRGIYQLVGDKIGEITGANVVLISSWDWDTEIVHIEYGWNYGEHLEAFDRPFSQLHHEIFPEIEKGNTLVWNENVHEIYERTGHVIAAGEIPKTVVAVPLKIGGKVEAFVSIQDFEKEFAFGQETIRLVETLTANMEIALENARLFEETQARNAELAVINSVQEGLAAEMDIQGIYRLVGDKVSEITGADVVLIGTMKWEEETLRAEYFRDGDQILHGLERPLSDFHRLTRKGVEAGETLIFNQGIEDLYKQLGHEVAGGKIPKTMVSVPMRIGRDYSAFISLQDTEKEFAFDEATIRLVETLTRNMETALENARLFDETQRLLNETADRNAELAVINSVQEGLASKLEMQDIYDLIGDKLREIFKADTCFISFHDEERTTITAPYYADNDSKGPLSRPYGNGIYEPIVESGKPVLFGSRRETKKLGRYEVKSPGASKDLNESVIGVPIFKDGKAIGATTIQSYQKNAYDEGDLRLLQTITNSMSVALESARLFDETQRLLKETEERNAELAVINSVQEGLASKLDMQGIYDVVGDKIREVFDAQTVTIVSYDRQAGQNIIHYAIEDGERHYIDPVPTTEMYRELMETGTPIIVQENLIEQLMDKTVLLEDPAGESSRPPKSGIWIPLSVSGTVIGHVSLQNNDRENAFSEADIRLLTTLANSMSVALENARLFDETSQRNSELAVINSVQQGLASKLDMTAIYDLVGDKVAEITGAEIVTITRWNTNDRTVTYEYTLEKGVKYSGVEREMTPYDLTLVKNFEKGKTVIFNSGIAELIEKENIPILVGEMPKTIVAVPIKTDDNYITNMSLQDTQREYAFDEATIRLVETLAKSMGIALENARLFNEVQQQNQEITESLDRETASNDILRVIAESPTDIQPVLDVIAKSAAHLSGSDDAVISFVHNGILTVDSHYGDVPIMPVGEGIPFNEESVAGRAIIQGVPLQAVHKAVGEPSEFPEGDKVAEEYGYKVTCSVPLIRDGTAIGSITIRRTRPELLTDQQISLIQSFANQATIAIQNVRLFEETQERNAELALINSVQAGLAAEINFQGIIDLVGDKLREVFDAQFASITEFDHTTKMMYRRYAINSGVRHYPEPTPFTRTTKYLIRKKRPFLNNRVTQETLDKTGDTVIDGTKMSKSTMYAPLIANDKVFGSISIQDEDNYDSFSDSDLRLLTTIANSMSVALENARLFEQLQTRNDEITSALERQTATSDILHIIANSPGEIQPVLDSVAAHAAKLCEADDVQIYQVDEENLVQVSHFGPLPALQNGESLPLKTGLATGKAVIERKTIQLDAGELSAEEYPISVKLQKRLKHRSVIMTPLVREGKSIGAIVARRNEVREFSEIQENLLRTFADQAAIAIENVRLFEETKRLLSESQQQAEELKTVNTVSQALSAEIEMDALIEMIGNQVQNIFSADIAYVALLDSDSQMINFPFIHGETIRPLKLGEGLASRVIQEGAPVLINQDEQWESAGERIGVKSKSYLGVPIFAGKEVIGVISIQSTQWSNMYGEADERLLSTIAANVGAAISNANLFSEVERQKVYLEGLISSAPVAIVQIDLHGDVSGWSPAAEELFGYTDDEAIGRNIDDLVANDPSVREEAENYTKINLIKPGPHQIQIKTQRTHKDGHLIDVTVSAMPVYIEGEHKGYIAIYNDISELEKARRNAEEANQAKSAFLANMSHELRTPLNAIIGFTRIVKRKGQGVLEEKQLNNLEKVLVSAEHLLGLINTVLDISKIEAGRMDIHVSNFEIKPLIDLLVVTTQPLIREETVSLIVDVDEDMPLIHSDLEKLKQILLNLLSNAAKFTHAGEIRVTVCHTGGFLEVDVSDTGIGIAPEALDSVFEEFQQADVSTTREYGGTGLGLSISRSLARLLGGDLRVASELGKGSTFTLTIPADYATATVVEDPGTVPDKKDGDQLVLVIDDNPDAIYLMQENLQNAGYKVAVARNGEDGLAMAKELKPFAITLDIMMPKKDGWQVLHDLKLDPETRGIPVIMITIVDKKALGFRLGAADYLVKPLDEDQVLVSLDKLKKQNGDRPLKRLLVVDDDPNIPDMVRQLLEDSSYQVESAADGQEAWERIQQDRPDALLLDLMMPKMDGFALIDRLNQDTRYTDLPVIVLTAKLLSKKERDSLNDSVGRVIQKQGLAGEALLNEIRSSINETI